MSQLQYELQRISQNVHDLETHLEEQQRLSAKYLKDAMLLREKCKDLSATIVEQKTCIDELKAKLRIVEASPEDVWFYDPMHDNDTQSLTCPVVMTSDKLREYEGKAKELGGMREKLAIAEATQEQYRGIIVSISEAVGGNVGDYHLATYIKERLAERLTYKTTAEKMSKDIEKVHQAVAEYFKK